MGTEKTWGKVLAYFDKHKAYLNPDLSMEVLSSDLNVPKHQLTEVLNIGLGKNFFHRSMHTVEAVKKCWQIPETSIP